MRPHRLGKPNWGKGAYALLLALVATAIALPAQTFTNLHSFDGADGYQPVRGLVQATNGNLYGTTNLGGANSSGTVFKITPSGTLTTLHSFCSQSGCTDGGAPSTTLIQATNGDLYGTTYNGGANSSGTIFKITPSGTLTTLHSFDETDGYGPVEGVVQATNSELYGTMYSGGANSSGTVFKITPSGTLTTIYSFCSQSGCTDGSQPSRGEGMVEATNGALYGITEAGGAYGSGTIFKITPSGTLTTLHSFDGTDGQSPEGGLVQATNGNLYGTTSGGGANSSGTIFKITPSGTLTTLHSFDGTDGLSPKAALIQATNGNLYGTTSGGGANSSGTIFKITPSGTLTTLHSFCSRSDCTDGSNPYFAGLVQETNGTLYGMTYGGGANGDGAVFSLSVGLGLFVELQTTYGKVGAAVKILGTNLTGASSVTFNSTAATFTVVSGSEITTTVPAGATTGTVKVVAPSGTLSSNVTFRVTPVISTFSPTSGPVGTSVVITGNSLTGATSVTFGGAKATSFTVNSYTQVTATVPTDAKTGKIGTTTPGGTATSATVFTVTP